MAAARIHGDIRVNGSVQLSWAATRQGELDNEETFHVYHWEISDDRAVVSEGALSHRYADGLVGLAMAVLQAANDAGFDTPPPDFDVRTR